MYVYMGVEYKIHNLHPIYGIAAAVPADTVGPCLLCIVGKFGEGLRLAVWRSLFELPILLYVLTIADRLPNLNSANITM